MIRAVFIDRDGVLIEALKIDNKPKSIKKLNEIKVIKDVKAGIKLLKKKFKLIIVTNQPDVARKIITKKSVNEINNFLKKKLKIDYVLECFHDVKDKCKCRKPKSGLFIKAKKNWKIDLKKSYMIGDRKIDIIAGNNAGCKNFFIDYQYAEKKPSKKYCEYVESFYQAALKIYKYENIK
jgi:D-glycero-D-manno-heptose 1,7-bisphosphate phosphatase